ncbi:MAG TPA: carboxymuconolactone decarboxylase family protein [Kofleriaceae bacterium]|nr:carboxymuconolactone decarboxylase family protein [Kofleriaceae bacterium]
MKTLAIIAATIALFHVSTAAAEPDAKSTYKDIEKTLGFVPQFFKAFPEEGIAAAWDELKSVQLNPKTALPGKTKELIGLGVAAQIPCKYCIYFHTQIAKLNGATDREISEAIAMAGATRHWSTVANGLQIDFTEFKQEVGRVFAYVKNPTPKGDAVAVTDAASAYKDIERTLGSVPTFLRRFPEVGIASAWRMMKTVQLNPSTALPGKTKELLGLAVAAQIPCQYCIYFHTEAAKLNGATDAEIREAVAIGAITRNWSTVLNGSQADESQFRKDVDHVVANVKKAAAKK